MNKKKKALILALLGAIIGFMYSLLMSEMFSMLITIPVLAITGGIAGWMIDRKQKNSED